MNTSGETACYLLPLSTAPREVGDTDGSLGLELDIHVLDLTFDILTNKHKYPHICYIYTRRNPFTNG